MTLSLAPMSREWADEVGTWRYESPYDVYDAEASTPAALLDGNHLAILDDGAFVGYVATGTEARVRGGPTEEPGVTDVGIGLAPDRLGTRRGTRAGALAVETLRSLGHVSLRVSILASNDRSRSLAARLGFVECGEFADDVGRRFVVASLVL